MGTEVAIQVLLTGPSAEQQTTQCAIFAEAQGWSVKSIFPPEAVEQSVRSVEFGLVELVVMAVVNAESLRIEKLITHAGGKVAYCRQSSGRYNADADTSGVVAYHHRHGHPADEIAGFMRVSVDRVRRALRRRGL